MTQTLPLLLSTDCFFCSVCVSGLVKKSQYQYLYRPDEYLPMAENFPAFQLHCTVIALDILFTFAHKKYHHKH